jgi:hypothetical protein
MGFATPTFVRAAMVLKLLELLVPVINKRFVPVVILVILSTVPSFAS